MTHRSNMHPRDIELKMEAQSIRVTFWVNQGDTVPRGIYMMFVVSNTSVSHAKWVMFQ